MATWSFGVVFSACNSPTVTNSGGKDEAVVELSVKKQSARGRSHIGGNFSKMDTSLCDFCKHSLCGSKRAVVSGWEALFTCTCVADVSVPGTGSKRATQSVIHKPRTQAQVEKCHSLRQLSPVQLL